jgi:hypothetical protein
MGIWMICKSMLFVFYSSTQPFFLPQISLLPSRIFGLVLLLKSGIQIVHETWWGNLSAHGANPGYLFDSISTVSSSNWE